MTIDRHLKIAGALQVAQGIFSLLFGSVIVFLNIRDLRRMSGPDWQVSSAVTFWLIALVLAIAFLVGGFQVWFGRSLAKQKRWATRVVGFIWCFLGLFSFPIGTIINGYTLWVLVQIDKWETRMTEPSPEPYL